MSILFNNPLLGAAGQGPSADLGDTIEQSLRFRGNRNGATGGYLERTIATAGDGANLTLSAWLKQGETPESLFVMSCQPGGNGSQFTGPKVNSNGTLYQYPQPGGGSSSTNVFRDPSAWYHFVWTVDDGQWNYYINGELVFQPTTSDNRFFNAGRRLEVASMDNGASRYGQYLAQVYCIDGQALDPTDFGKYNEDGVWVPQDYTGTYGTNGFHLDFADSSDLGNDVSGNNNDFTVIGFDTGDVALYSKDLSAQGGFLSNMEPAKAFNGSLSDAAGGATNGGNMTFAPSTAIPVTSSVSWYSDASTSGTSLTWNGTTVNRTSTGWTTITGSGELSATNTFQWTGDGNPSSTVPTCRAIAIDGTATANILVDNTDNDVDYLDTPTSNFATLNPLAVSNPSEGKQYEKANLGMIAGNLPMFVSTIAMPDNSGIYYWEVINGSATGGIGVCSVNSRLRDYNISDDNTLITDNGTVVVNGTQNSNAWNNSNFGNGLNQVYGCQYDSSTRRVRFYVSGDDPTFTAAITTVGTNEIAVPASWGDVYAVGSAAASAGNVSINFGQHNFIYQPASTVALETNNLTEPTIKNGKEHFDVLTWTGDGASPKTRTGLEFTPDFVWIKERNQAFSIGHRLYDSVRGAGVNKHLDSSSTNAEGVGNDEDYGYVTGFVDGGFTAQAGTTGDDYVNDTSTNYVAWCWKAGGTAVSNTDGTITSSVSANTTAGFSIIGYAGSGTSGDTVGHGLSSTPELVIVKNRSAAENWQVKHPDLNANQNLELSSTSGVDTAPGSGFISSIGSSTITLSAGASNQNNVNASGNNYIIYAWHSVEGYSKFGSYTGNGSADGPFVYLGFKPSLIICKASSSTGSWTIVDSARDSYNPSGNSLSADVANAESGPDQYSYVDFLANGFKWRTNQASRNSSGVTYVYMAFAENPFGGENAPPATAR